MRTLALVLLLAGCGYSSSEYLADAGQVSCDIVLECTDWYGGPAACLAALEREDTRKCSYDAQAARRCIAELRQATCPVGGGLPQEPSVCASVWADCDVAQAHRR